jgi:tRNA(Arg) A34 adenosine deaminase TadA
MTPFHEREADHLRRATGSASEAHERGDAPFGAVLVGKTLTVRFAVEPKPEGYAGEE